jgi:FtsP/CotA-like multicopper oxidase with cupredoxin domain
LITSTRFFLLKEYLKNQRGGVMKRRDFLTIGVKSAMAAGLTGAVPASLLRTHTAHAEILAAGLSDPAAQPLFTHSAPNAMAAGFKYIAQNNKLTIDMGQAVQMTGLVGADGMTPVPTTIWGYGTKELGVTWPGRTLEINTADDPLEVTWHNNLVSKLGNTPLPHLLPVDTNLHWAYSLHGYESNSIAANGVPVVPHIHGGHNDSPFDGNPEYFFSPDFDVKGPRWVSKKYTYGGPDWNDTAGMTWYHDHALGITRLNVYAGLAGFFPLRDDADTSAANNPLGLPADPYELGFAVQDRMFRNTGELFYPAFPGDPFYADFITGEGAVLPEDLFPGGGPSALAEFFGDHMVVNGIIWPKYDVEQRQYRVRLLNGCDSRFMRLQFKVIEGGAGNLAATDPTSGYSVPFYVIGSDQSLRSSAVQVEGVDFAPGERLDLVIDFKDVPVGSRIIVENVLGDSPFGGGLPKKGDLFPDRRTNRVMSFDVTLPFDNSRSDTGIYDGYSLGGGADVGTAIRTRKLALFEGTDEFGRLQPLLGTAEPVYDVEGNSANGAIAWHSPITENPGVGDTEIWELYNATGDAHPIHVHLVHFEVVNRQAFNAKSIEQPVLQHNGSFGVGFRLEDIKIHGQARGPETQEQTRRDMVTALPGEVTRIKMTFDKAGRYVWHCHILSHEDHEMMRPLHVGPGPF